MHSLPKFPIRALRSSRLIRAGVAAYAPAGQERRMMVL
jgi:hypothetical protein